MLHLFNTYVKFIFVIVFEFSIKWEPKWTYCLDSLLERSANLPWLAPHVHSAPMNVTFS